MCGILLHEMLKSYKVKHGRQIHLAGDIEASTSKQGQDHDS